MRLTLLIVASVSSGIILGLLYHFVGRWVDLMWIAPLGLGFILGIAVFFLRDWTRYFRRSGLVAAAVLAGLTVFPARYFGDSQSLRPIMVEQFSTLLAQERGMTPQEAHRATEHYLGPIRTYQLYLDALSSAGITRRGLISGSSYDRGIPVSGGGFWLLLLLRMGLLCCVAGSLAFAAGETPRCPYCGHEQEKKTLLRFGANQMEEVVAALRSGRGDDLAAVPQIGGSWDAKNHTDALLFSCRKCARSRVSVRHALDGKPGSAYHAFVEPASAEALREISRRCDA